MKPDCLVNFLVKIMVSSGLDPEGRGRGLRLLLRSWMVSFAPFENNLCPRVGVVSLGLIRSMDFARIFPLSMNEEIVNMDTPVVLSLRRIAYCNGETLRYWGRSEG